MVFEVLMNILKSPTFQWALVIVSILLYFLFIHALNDRENRIRYEPKSLFETKEIEFNEKLKLITPEPQAAMFYSSYYFQSQIPSFTVEHPATWSATLKNKNDLDYITLSPDNFSKTQLDECIDIYQSEDSMPILEAKNYNKFLLEATDLQYLTKEEVETTIASSSAIVSKLRPDKIKPEEFVNNAIIVKENKYSYIIRGCKDTSDEIFYRVLKSFTFEE